MTIKQGPVARKPTSASPGLNVVQGFCLPCLKALPLPILRDKVERSQSQIAM